MNYFSFQCDPGVDLFLVGQEHLLHLFLLVALEAELRLLIYSFITVK